MKTFKKPKQHSYLNKKHFRATSLRPPSLPGVGLSQDTSLRSDREVGHFDSSAVALPPSSMLGEGDVMRARSDVTKATASVASTEGACVGAGAGGG